MLHSGRVRLPKVQARQQVLARNCKRSLMVVALVKKVFKSHSSTAYLHLQSSSFHLVCRAHKDKVVYGLIAGSAIGA